MQVVTIAGLKGGLGKTTTAVHLAAWWARSQPTLLVDADPQASALSWAAHADPPPAFAVAALPVRDLARKLPALARGQSTVVVDTGPGDEQRATLLGALLASDLAVVPLAPSYLEHDRLRSTIDLLDEATALNPKLQWTVLLTRVRAGTKSAAGAATALTAQHIPTVATRIPLAERYLAAFGTSLTGDLGAYEHVAGELAGLLSRSPA